MKWRSFTGSTGDCLQPVAVGVDLPQAARHADHGHTVSRTLLDTLLLEHAEKAGAVVRQGADVTEPIIDGRGRVTGVVLKGGEKVYGDAVVAADGAYSPSNAH